jgi:hypothetical protein
MTRDQRETARKAARGDWWTKKPAEWEALPDFIKMEAMRLHFCTGPCGQSNNVLSARSQLDRVLTMAVAKFSTMDYDEDVWSKQS